MSNSVFQSVIVQLRDISDRIIFMDKGLVAVSGTPDEVFSSDHQRMQEFLGKLNRHVSET